MLNLFKDDFLNINKEIRNSGDIYKIKFRKKNDTDRKWNLKGEFFKN